MSDKPLPPPQPLNQSLPPLPPLQTKELPKMHIARRPVAATKPVAPPKPQPEEHSPTGSIGSLLSAYSRSSGESLMAKSPSTQRDSAPMFPSEHEGTTKESKVLTPTSASSVDNEASYSRLGAPNLTHNKGLPPSPAYAREQGPPPPAKAAAGGGDSPTSFTSTSSQQQRPLWRRRSVKSDRNIEVPDLKLANLPSTQEPTEEMGQEASRLREKVSHVRGQNQTTGANVGASHSDTALSPSQRLPTPDYEKEDVKTPVVDTVVSPISPASSPEPAAAEQKQQPIPRKAVTDRNNVQNVHNAKSLPQMRVDPPTTSSEAPPTIARDFAVSPISPEAQQGQFPARNSSNQQQQQPPQQQQRGQWLPAAREHAAQGGDMRRDQRPGQEPVEYREMKQQQDMPADPRASFFPITTPEPPSPSIVYSARPIKESMLDCYARHRTVDRTRNRNYALSCQTCGKADTEDRFKCQWCYVRMCASCLTVFNRNGRDLRQLLAHLESNPQGSSDADGANNSNEAATSEEHLTVQQQPSEGQQYHQQQHHHPQMVTA
ncbi:hypothetical protein K4K49_000636 [Colletotrichum sp. SAR 10_70]|nr:hypothetical protein K4K50_002922 [Colletotrichum sp. SAR 10_71]KAI8184396.1 hypothetical protein K4K49_000636 [Colletotrichum sp. SAR 10_70]KAI8190938.1 hypothetical protein KHU50_000365 [Colletotrichum sp. SAR 10_65]KAI8208485.1 hypothetical protein K4K52_001264 [Colletotrichum sp. SAR 10_76]KAI8248105.1 hypothetical protein K4K53_001114 [Colletotrichum sp. SAR 10_77]KAJ4999600.1 hypothetical protein K4K48_003901 [Colletotrichum sp. SAR 10_66]